MAFTGVAKVSSLGCHVVHINNVSLAAGAGSGSDIELPSSFPSELDGDAVAAGLNWDVIVEWRYNFHSIVGNDSSHLHYEINNSPFYITVTNDDGGRATGTIHMYIQYHHSLTR